MSWGGALAKLGDVRREDLPYIDATAHPYACGPTRTASQNRASLQAAADQACLLRCSLYLGTGAFSIDGQIAITAPIDVFGSGRATILTLAPDITGFYVNQIDGVRFHDFSIDCQSPGVAPYKAAIIFDRCVGGYVDRLTITGMSWAGVFGTGSDAIRIRGCSMSGWRGAINDSSDVVLYNTTNSEVFDNDLMGGGWCGVLVQDPTSPGTSSQTDNCIIDFNRIGAHSAYGICCYENGYANTRHKISRNRIRDINGVNPGGSGGAGIYLLSSGGGVVESNDIANCCINTSNETLVPAGIGVNCAQDPVHEPWIIRSNNIRAMAQFQAIRVVGATRGVVVTGNVIDVISNVSSNTGGVRLINCAEFVVDKNRVCGPSTGTGGMITIEAINLATNDGVVSGNVVVGGSAYGIRVLASSFSATGLALTGNRIRSTAAGYVGLRLLGDAAGIFDSVVTDNAITCAIPLLAQELRTSVISENVLRSTATNYAQLSGAFTGSKWAFSNVTVGALSSTATGLSAEAAW